jgi:hypothetical protein
MFLIGQKLVAEGYLTISLTLYLTPPSVGRHVSWIDIILNPKLLCVSQKLNRCGLL